MFAGNDFSTLYAPLIRDGRMEKYYWNPTREDRIGVCMGIFIDDAVNRQDVEQLVDTFPGQSIDFFGALRARVYDEQVRNFIQSIGVENLGKRLVNSREGKVNFEKPRMTLDILMKFGKALVQEQENVKRVQLADEYMKSEWRIGCDCMLVCMDTCRRVFLLLLCSLSVDYAVLCVECIVASNVLNVTELNVIELVHAVLFVCSRRSGW